MTRLWERAQLSPTARPWQGAQAVYDRKVDVHRQRTVAVSTGGVQQVGQVGYSDNERVDDPLTPATEGEAVLYVGLPASIQAKTQGRTKGTLLPADVVYKPGWDIFIPSSDIAQYDIRDRDLIIDDEGYRYAIGAAEWSALGYRLECIRLEA